MYNQYDLDVYASALIANFRSWKESTGHRFNNEDYVVTFEEGNKYIRVVRSDADSTSVVAFVEIATGDIYKPETWKKPAKTKPRGNILALTPNVVCWSGAR